MKRIIFCFLLFNLLVSCMHHTEETGTPMIKTVTTKTTTVTKSKRYYRVFGKPYKVLKTSKNYEAHGVASWYGRPFHKRRTSSGERYNMYKLTAAHKTLPLKTKLMVTNLLNGRKVVVKVNDRGPFVSDRLIDLSYAAAKKIGMVGLGVAPVDIKAIS